MTYATQQDLLDAFGASELLNQTDIDPTPTGAIVTARVDRAIAAAAGEVEGYLAARYQVPLASVPANVKQAVCDIARYRLYRDNAPELVVENYKAAIRLCRDISTGAVRLPLPTGNEPERTESLVDFAGGQHVFARESLRGCE
ncbi:gp436 family protein [Rhodocyclus tenuis]|uniref:Phage gp36-like protein n=1 Tax=Rhodocyclus tenuis TaxID=1066 RepID=A0A840GGB7_RHOTE|nr:DUF1320 domain-containing protein [Rhodocyclus tenuis]MBB4247249.1 phage gp36-like protein [Rhodocyclus tenuis]